MSDRTTEPDEFRANQDHDHAITSLSGQLASCICGWQSKPQQTPEDTRQEAMHHALSTLTLFELVDEVLRRDDVSDALAGLSPEEKEECRQAARPARPALCSQFWIGSDDRADRARFGVGGVAGPNRRAQSRWAGTVRDQRIG